MQRSFLAFVSRRAAGSANARSSPSTTFSKVDFVSSLLEQKHEELTVQKKKKEREENVFLLPLDLSVLLFKTEGLFWQIYFPIINCFLSSTALAQSCMKTRLLIKLLLNTFSSNFTKQTGKDSKKPEDHHPIKTLISRL